MVLAILMLTVLMSLCNRNLLTAPQETGEVNAFEVPSSTPFSTVACLKWY